MIGVGCVASMVPREMHTGFRWNKSAETWCLKAKTVAKLNSIEMDFWRRSVRISRKDKIRNNIIKQKMNVTRYLLEDIKTKQLKWYGHVQRMEEEDC